MSATPGYIHAHPICTLLELDGGCTCGATDYLCGGVQWYLPLLFMTSWNVAVTSHGEPLQIDIIQC